MTISDNIEY